MNFSVSVESLVQKRQSARKFEAYDFGSAEVDSIKEIFASLDSLNSRGIFKWEIGKQFIMGSGIVFARLEKTDGDSLADYGFEGEQIVLKLTELKYGTCWSRLPNGQALIIVGKPSKDASLERAQSILYRGLNRKPLEDLLEGDNVELTGEMSRIIEAGRLAPSAFNRQFWTFHVPSEKEIVVRILGKPPLIYGDMVQVDLGVVISHLYLAAREIVGGATVKKLEDYKYSIEIG